MVWLHTVTECSDLKGTHMHHQAQLKWMASAGTGVTTLTLLASGDSAWDTEPEVGTKIVHQRHWTHSSTLTPLCLLSTGSTASGNIFQTWASSWWFHKSFPPKSWITWGYEGNMSRFAGVMAMQLWGQNQCGGRELAVLSLKAKSINWKQTVLIERAELHISRP